MLDASDRGEAIHRTNTGFIGPILPVIRPRPLGIEQKEPEPEHACTGRAALMIVHYSPLQSQHLTERRIAVVNPRMLRSLRLISHSTNMMFPLFEEDDDCLLCRVSPTLEIQSGHSDTAHGHDAFSFRHDGILTLGISAGEHKAGIDRHALRLGSR